MNTGKCIICEAEITLTECSECEKMICDDCYETCDKCREPVCVICDMETCDECGDRACSMCEAYSGQPNLVICDYCVQEGENEDV